MVDTSESMNSGEAEQQVQNWMALKEFIKKFIRTLNVEGSSTKVAVLRVSGSYLLLWEMGN